ncbi:MAG TPA: IS21 family transposase, partial [Acidimicrobiales bacterium]|nr:IS21 family transposase [Acidimicrobiales bacterium]
MIQVLEVLRRWLRGDGGVRVIAQGAGVDRKTAQRYIDAAQELGLTRSGGDEQLTDEFIGRVREVVRPSRAGEHGSSWELLTTHEEQIKQWVDDDLTVAKIGDLLVRRGVQVPDRTLQRFCFEKFTKPRNNTVRVADGEPGQELQTDFGRMGMLFDPHTNRRRVVHALIVVAVWS